MTFEISKMRMVQAVKNSNKRKPSVMQKEVIEHLKAGYENCQERIRDMDTKTNVLFGFQIAIIGLLVAAAFSVSKGEIDIGLNDCGSFADTYLLISIWALSVFFGYWNSKRAMEECSRRLGLSYPASVEEFVLSNSIGGRNVGSAWRARFWFSCIERVRRCRNIDEMIDLLRTKTLAFCDGEVLLRYEFDDSEFHYGHEDRVYVFIAISRSVGLPARRSIEGGCEVYTGSWDKVKI